MTNNFFSNIWKNKNFLSVFLTTIIFFIVVFIYLSGFWALTDKNIQKWIFNYSWKADDRIVVIEIDEKTVKSKENWWLWRFPFDREVYAKIIKNLNEVWAWVIWFDIIFADETNLMSDSIFSKAVSEAENIVLWVSTIPIQPENNIFEAELPINWLFKWAIWIWFFDVSTSVLNNVAFSVSPYKNYKNWSFEYFWITLLRAYYSIIFNDENFLKSKLEVINNNITINNKIIIPLSLDYNENIENSDILINYTKSTISYRSFIDFYNDDAFEWLKKQYWEKFLKDKIVIIWTTLRWKDIFKTPLDEELWKNFWIYVHANFLNTVLTKNFSKYLDPKYELILIILLSILSIYINLNNSWKTLFFTNLSILWILILYLSIVLKYNLVLNFPFELFLSFLLALLLSNIIKYWIENKDKTKLNKALSEYVSKDIAAEILSWAWAINLDWEKKRISIFFSDIQWFTTISERFTPEELISFLKDYLNEMSNIIMDKKWLINKYEWDAIMALWWVFTKTTENISYDACDSALIQKQKLKELNKKWIMNWLPEIIIRIWINVGDAIIWNIWSKWRKMEFTAIWDNVNLASRLEAINKHYWTYMCVSESVYIDTKDFFEFRYLDKIKVKWKNNAVNIYELLDYKWKLSKIELDIYAKFQQWIDLYLKKHFDEAAIIFDELASLWDKPSRVYKDRCEDFIKAPIEDWDWIWVMQEK